MASLLIIMGSHDWLIMPRDWLDTLKYQLLIWWLEIWKYDGAWYEKFMEFK